jgi:hypothetical protein
MINYTERIALLMHDIVVRTPRLSFIDLREVIVFGRYGRSDAEGAFATCHCLTLPESEPGYYFWRDRSTDSSHAARMVRHEVAAGPDRRHAREIPDLVRAAAILRSVARAVAQGGVVPRRHAGWLGQARHDRPRALSHRS